MASLRPSIFLRPLFRPATILRTPCRRFTTTTPVRRKLDPIDDPNFSSILDKPVPSINTRKKHSILGLSLLFSIPLIAAGLGTWQIYRLNWKTELIARYEDALLAEPLPLPPRIDPAALEEFDYRRVIVEGRWRHDLEMLLGPRVHEEENGFNVVTPLERADGGGMVLVNRGWISKKKADQRKRHPDAVPTGLVTVEGLLRKPYKKNMFTPENNPEKNAWYFPDVKEMAAHTGAQEVYIEEIWEPELVKEMQYMADGRPIGKEAVVNLKNDHLQYIVTWYSLSAATAFMFFLLVRKPQRGITRRVKASTEWS